MNCQRNKSTKVSPHYVVFGRHPSLRFPEFDDENLRNTDPVAYGMEISSKINDVGKACQIAAEEADRTMEQRLDGKETPPLNKGDQVYLYRPQSEEAKRTKNNWIGPYSVTKTNLMVNQIEDQQGNLEWVHRFHLRAVPDRPERLRYSPPIPDPAILATSDDEIVLPEDWSEDPDPSVSPVVQQHEKPTELIPTNTEPKPVTNTEPESNIDTATVPDSHTTDVPQRRSSRIPVRIRREPARYKDYVRY